MGLMDKFKNLFTDEEVVEDDEDEKVEIKEIKKEPEQKLPTFMREKIEKEESQPQVMKIEDDITETKEVKLETPLDSEPAKDVENRFKFPIDITEEDFVERRTSRQEIHNHKENLELEEPTYLRNQENNITHSKPTKKELKVSEIYKDKREDKENDEKKFRATPIISPIYGVLDKNYNPDDVENRRGHNLEDTRPSKSIDFDSVRKKAYGNISKEIKENLMCEDCEYLKEAKECKKHQREQNEEYYEKYEDLEEYHDPEPEEEYKDITMDEAAENYFDYGVAYEKGPNANNNYYLDENDEEEVKIIDHTEEEEEPKKNEIPPVKSSINLLSTLKKSQGDDEEEEEPKKEKNLELTDDLFNLIDSMYDERNDDK